jgi:hypothetical protein
MKTLLKKPASLLAILTMVLAIAFISSCSDSSGSGDDLLGSCMTPDRDICVELLGNYDGGATAARQDCVDKFKGTWGAGSACPTTCTEEEDHRADGGIVYACVVTGSGDGSTQEKAITLTAGAWKIGTMTAAGEVWFKYNATGTTYVRWDDSYNGSGTYTDVDVLVTAYDSNGEDLFQVDTAYEECESQMVASTGTIYLQVTPYGEDTGAFRIMYSNSMTCPDRNIFGSCKITEYDYDDPYEYCLDDYSQYECERYDGAFNPGGTCPLGSCEYYDYNSGEDKCVANVSRSECTSYDGYDGYFISSNTCVRYCAYYDEDDDPVCEEIGKYEIDNRDACWDLNGSVLTAETCDAWDYTKFSPLSSPKKK